MVTPTNHIIPGWICIARGPWYFQHYRNIFLPNVGEDQKKSFHLNAEPLPLPHMVNSSLDIALRL